MRHSYSNGENPGKVLGFARMLESFVSYATELLGSNTEVLNGPRLSPNGTVFDQSTLTGIHDNLISKSSCLHDRDLSAQNQAQQAVWPDVDAFNEVADACWEHYWKLNKLLVAIRDANEESARWSSFREALQSFWYPNEISDLEEGCRASWIKLTKHVCTFSRYWAKEYLQFCTDFRATNNRQREDIPEHFRNQIDYSSQFESMPRLVHELHDRLEAIEHTGRASTEDMDFCITSFATLEFAGNVVRGGNITTESLVFDGYDAQLKSIPGATEPMFNWAFSSSESPGSPRSGSDLKTWLRQGYGVGLVTGESGCGKSMLMKHLSTHPDLGGTLYQWSNPRPVVVASHFFCGTGTLLQRSRLGLLRTLLRTLLLQLPGDAEAIYREHGARYPEKLREYCWSERELESHLLNIVGSHRDIKFCFFIDGLDDYDSDKSELLDFLQRLLRAGHGNCKICLSSTGDDVKSVLRTTVSHFAVGGNFLLNDLEIYLAERLKQHPWFHNNHPSAPKRIDLARSVTAKYRNFLWGRLAVEHLCTRHHAEPTFEGLKRSLDEMPSSPIAMVKHCLRATPANFIQSGAYFFLVALSAKEPPPLAIYHFLTLELRDPDYALKLDHKALNLSEHEGIRRSTLEGLEKRCGSFLQARTDLRVGFPHIALRDIFGGSDLTGALRAKASPKVQVYLSLARAYLAYMKTSKLSWGRPTFSYKYLRNPPFLQVFGIFLAVAREIQTSHRMHRLLDDWETCFKAKSQTDQLALEGIDRIESNTRDHFRKPILDAFLIGYVDYKVRKQPSFLRAWRGQNDDYCPPALSLVLTSAFDTPREKRENHMEMLVCLFRHAPDPNEPDEPTGDLPVVTPWTNLVRQTLNDSEFIWALRSGLFSLFIKHGADPNAPVLDSHPPMFGPKRRTYTSSWVVLVHSISQMLHHCDTMLSEADQQACLDMMEHLCRQGASAESHPERHLYNYPESCSDTVWAQRLVSHILDCGGPERLGHPVASALRLGLVENMLLILVRSGFDIDWSWDLLQRCSSPEAFRSIKDRILREKRIVENGRTPETGAPNHGKRPSDEMIPDGDSPSKRSRSETSDETMTMTTNMTMRMDMSPNGNENGERS